MANDSWSDSREKLCINTLLVTIFCDLGKTCTTVTKFYLSHLEQSSGFNITRAQRKDFLNATSILPIHQSVNNIQLQNELIHSLLQAF